MNIQKLAPWNWFMKEEELHGATVPVKRGAYASEPVVYPLEHMHRELDRLFDEAFRGFGFPALRPGAFPAFGSRGNGWLAPSVDIGSTDTEYTISVELPGVSQKDVHLEVSGDTLRIHGEKQHEKEDKGRDYYSMERSYGAFQRVLALPDDARASDIAATFKDGVMTITIPRAAASLPAARHIEVKAA